MPNVFIIHGSNGSPEENWFPWLKQELEKINVECTVPAFPCGETHSLELWYKEFEKYKHLISPNTIIVGHSRGVSFVLNLLTDLDYQIKSFYMVGGFDQYLWYEKDEPIDSFFTKKFDIEKIKKQCKKFVNIYSDNDPYIPVNHSQQLTQTFGAIDVFIQNAGHFNTASGYTNFPQLLELIKYDLSPNQIL